MKMGELRQEWVDVAEEKVGYPIRYAVLKGSRLFGINEPFSDIDLIVCFQYPTEDILSIDKKPHTFDITYDQDGLEIDLKAYELERFIYHSRSHNGNFTEGLCAPEGYFFADEVGHKLRAVGVKYKTKKLYSFYCGYAFNQLKRASNQIKTAKGLTYTFREAFCGIHLLRTGELIYGFHELATETQKLLGWKSVVIPYLTNTRAEISLRLIGKAWEEFAYLEKALDESLAISPLPETYDGTEELNKILLEARMSSFLTKE